MKKVFLIGLILLFPVLLFAQYNVDGRRIYKGTVGNDKLASTAIDGGVMLEATRYAWFPVSADSGSVVLQGTGGWTLDASVPPNVVWTAATTKGSICAFGFDADGGSTGDDVVYLSFVCPDDYETDTMELYLYFYHLDDDGGAADVVVWDGTVDAIGSAETLFGSGTAMTAVSTTCTASDSSLYIANLDPEVETIASGDLIFVQIFADESACTLDSSERAYLIGVLVEWEAKDE